MKKLYFLFLVLFTHFAYAQVPQGIPYQAAARNASGQALVNTAVKVRFSILDSVATGTVVYKETHSTTTNTLGLFNVNVGMGTPVTGTFSAINWGKNAKFMQMELDITGTGSSYVDMGTQQMLSVPYALYAGSAKNSDNTSAVAGNTYIPQTRTGFDASTTWTCPAGVTQITVELWGGSGGGGGSAGVAWANWSNYCGFITGTSFYVINGYGGGRGGDGGYQKATISVVPGNTYSIVIGAAGQGGNGGTAPVYNGPSQGANGTSGGNSTFGSTLVVANGGAGGTGSINSKGTSTAGTAGANAGITNYTHGATNFGSRTYVPISYLSSVPSINSSGGSGGAGFYLTTSSTIIQGGNAGSNGEAGYCIISY